jgi:hypothetical protein
MNFFRTLFISACLFVTNFSGFAQLTPGALSYSEQALVFSNYDYTGSARIHGIGNTQISLGGDISSALSNPAGLGFYNRSEITITPSFNLFQADSKYIGQNESASEGKFNIDNIGIVFNKTKSDNIPGKWRGGSFVISYSKINEFNKRVQYSGLNPNNDILDFYAQDANIQNVDPADLNGVTRGGYNSYLISEFLDAFVEGNDTTYIPFYERTFFSEFPSSNFPTNQSEIISSSGSQNQWNFSYGANYGDFLYFGATLGIQSLRYNVVKEYTELYPGLDGDIVDYSFLSEELLTEGIGINGTFGVIARPINQVTLGFSIITPTRISMSERYSFYTEAKFNNFNMNNYGDYFDTNYDLIENQNADFTTFYESTANLNVVTYDEESFFDYTLTTPMRLNGGITYFLNKNGFISGDVEYVDYSKMKLSAQSGSLSTENESIKQLYGSVVNFRVGGEWRVQKMRFRLGYNLNGNPIKTEGASDLSTQTLAGGLGLRSNKFYMDLASSYRMSNARYAPYVLENTDNNPIFETSFVDINSSNLNFMLSFGLFF